MLTAIMNALAAAVERATCGGADAADMKLFVDEESAARFLEEYSITASDIFSGNVAPLYIWLQAIYLTDGGTLPIGPDRLARVLDVPLATASVVLQKLASEPAKGER